MTHSSEFADWKRIQVAVEAASNNLAAARDQIEAAKEIMKDLDVIQVPAFSEVHMVAEALRSASTMLSQLSDTVERDVEYHEYCGEASDKACVELTT